MHSDIKKPITSSFILLPKFIQLGVIQVSVGSVFDVFLSNGPQCSGYRQDQARKRGPDSIWKKPETGS